MPSHLPAPRRRGYLAAGLSGALCACVATVDVRGFIPDEDAISKIERGTQSREQVQQILGTPSTISAFSDDTWFYVSRKTSTTAFFAPSVLEQNVVVVKFNPEGMVDDVARVDLADAMSIDPVSRVTPAQGKELTFLEQLLGNLGKFNQAPEKK